MKYKPATIFLLLLLLSLNLKAQVNYTDLEKLYKSISAIQSTANGLNYKYGNYVFTLTFPQVNFNVAFGSKLATHAAQSNAGTDILIVTDSIDLSKVNSLIEAPEAGSAHALRLLFKFDNLSSKYIEDGLVTGRNTVQFIDIFYKDATQKKVLASNLANLILTLKTDNRTLGGTKQEILAAWDKALADNTENGYKMFMAKNATSIFADQAELYLAGYKTVAIPNQKIEVADQTVVVDLATAAILAKQAFEEFNQFKLPFAVTPKVLKSRYPEIFKQTTHQKDGIYDLYKKKYDDYYLGEGEVGKVWFKNESCVGYEGLLEKRFKDDVGKKITSIANGLEKKFGFKPKYAFEKNGNISSYSFRWERDGYLVELLGCDSPDSYILVRYLHPDVF